jgi:uncharacterized repeat protein (TIGR01451 family)
MKKACLFPRNAAALATALLLSLAALTPSSANAAPASVLPESLTLEDQGQPIRCDIAKDEFYVLSADKTYSLRKIVPQPTAEALRSYVEAQSLAAGEQAGVVLYLQGVPKSTYSRRYLTRQVLARVEPGADMNALATATGAASVRSASASGYFLFSSPEPAGALALAEALRQQSGVVSAQPQLAHQLQPRWVPDDPLFTNQWHLLNTGQNGGTPGLDVNVTNVWDTYRGNGIVISVVDQGTQIAHPDLSNNVVAGLSQNYNGGNPNDPSPLPDIDTTTEFHGTAVSGVAAGRGNNTLGVSGAAPEAGLCAERLIAGPSTDAQEADAMAWKDQAIHVKNNSWGPGPAGMVIAGPGPLTEAALLSTVTAGRGGRGSIIVFAAGNGRESFENANFNGFANSIYTVAVAANDDRGNPTYYTTPGACLTVSAPSGNSPMGRQDITTTDLSGTNGYNGPAGSDYADQDYTKTFSGTSSASPLTAGVIALLLEAAPNLGWRDVQEVLMRSATVVNPASPEWVVNSAGFHFSHDFGAGMINAGAAIALGRTWQNLGIWTNVSHSANNLGLSIPDASALGVSHDFAVSDSIRLEHVALTVDITHPRRGDLQIVLTSPSGMQSILATPRLYDPFANIANWTFTTLRDWGESAAGTWTVTVSDRVNGSIGTVNSLKLTLYGTPGGAPPISGTDLALRLSANPDPVLVSSNLFYTVTVTNKGNLTADNVVVIHKLPPEVIFVSTAVTNGTAAQVAGVVTWTIGQVAGNGTTAMNVRVIPVVPGTIFSSAAVSSSTPDTDPSNNDFVNSVRVRPLTTDLTLSLTDSPDPVLVSSNLTYTASVTNRGPSQATGVTLATTLPSGMLLKTVTPSQGTWSSAGNIITCNFGGLTNGQRATVTITVTPLTSGNLVASGRVTGNQYDPVPQNNVAVTTTAVSPAADLALSLDVVPNPAVVGSNFTYLVLVTNRGPSAGSAVVVNQTLPAGVTFVSATASQGIVTPVSGNVVANLGTLNIGSAATVTVIARSGAAGLYASTATASATQADQNPADNSATVTITVAKPFVSIVAAGGTLTSESFSPPNGAIEPNEIVTVQLRLRNAGNVSNTNLVATLLETNGVAYVAGGVYTNSYGVLPGAGLPASSAFTFKALNTSNGLVVPTLRLRDGGKDIGFASFPFNLPVVTSFANPAAIITPVPVPKSGPATPYPSLIHVSGVTGVVGNVAITLSNLSHTSPSDINVLLVGPNGQKVLLMSHAGGTSADTSPIVNTVTLDATASTMLPEGNYNSGSYRPAAYAPAVTFPSPAPTNGYGTALSVFNGANPNGTWSLFVLDDSAGDDGQITDGWSLQIKTIFPVNQIADLSLAVTAAPDPVWAGDALTYRFTVQNAGPDLSANATFTNVLPASLRLVSVKPSQGTVLTNGNTVICYLGAIAAGGTATITNIVVPRPPAGLVTNLASVFSITNRASVFSSEVDLNPANNYAAATITSLLPQADLLMTLAAPTNAIVTSNLTYTLTVTNLGPQLALDSLATNTLPAGVALVSAFGTNATCTNIGQQVICDFGDLAPGAGGVVVIKTTVTSSGKLTNTVVACTTSGDTNAPNQATVVTTATQPMPVIAPAGSTLVGQSHLPPNGVINPGETVTMSFSLVNTGQVQTTSLAARLLPTGGVTAPSSNQTFGVLAPDGPATARQFTFTASSTATAILATLALSDGSNDLGTAAFVLDMPGIATRFTSVVPVAIPDHGAARPYPSSITVSGMMGLVSKVTVTLSNLTHGFPSDVNVLLVSPTGQAVRLMSAAGYGHSATNVTLSFDDVADASLPQSASLQSGTFKPTNYGNTPFPYPAPAGPYPPQLVEYNGFNPNGVWKLYIVDGSPGDAGSLAGWSLEISTVSPLTPAANLVVTGNSTPVTADAGSFLTNTFLVFNAGPDTAPGVMLTNTLAVGVALISATLSQGTVTNSGGQLLGDLGSLPSGDSAILTVVLVPSPSAAPTLTSAATAYAAATDLNLGNNLFTLFTPIVVPPAPTLSGSFDPASQTFTLTLTGEPDMTYTILVSSDLVTWSPLTTTTTGTDGKLQFTDDTAPGQPVRFYRAQREH